MTDQTHTAAFVRDLLVALWRTLRDPDYRPHYQDEYRRLWHEAELNATALTEDLANASRELDRRPGHTSLPLPEFGAGGGALVQPPTISEDYDELREEYDALGMLSYHGQPWGWAPDLSKDDVEKIRALLRRTGAAIEGLS